MLLSHFPDEEIKAPGGKGLMQGGPARTPDSGPVAFPQCNHRTDSYAKAQAQISQTAALSEPKAGLRNPGLRQPAYATGGTAPKLTA